MQFTKPLKHKMQSYSFLHNKGRYKNNEITKLGERKDLDDSLKKEQLSSENSRLNMKVKRE
jgi:hypothetical protein